MKFVTGVAAVSMLLMQPSGLSPRDLLSNSRTLTAIEIATVLDASQRAMAGRTFRLVSNGHATDVLMGRAGKPRRIRSAGAIVGGVVGGSASGSGDSRPMTTTTWRRDYITVTDYTGRPARYCDGSAEPGEFVDIYSFDSSTARWTTSVRLRDRRDFGGLGIAPIFETLRGARTMTSGELKQIGPHPARAFTSSWAPPTVRVEDVPVLIGDPIPNLPGASLPSDPAVVEAVQSLWIDTRSLLAVRWEVSERGLHRFGFDFDYTSIDMRLPKAVRPPAC